MSQNLSSAVVVIGALRDKVNERAFALNTIFRGGHLKFDKMLNEN